MGIALPTRQLTRSSAPDSIKAGMAAAGYTVDLQYSDNTQVTQNSQIENMIKEHCDILVISSVDSGALGHVLKEAAQANIPLIAYDKLLTNTNKCDYYVTFDNYSVGRMQGQYIAGKLGLNTGAKGSFSLECFAGDPNDNNADLYYRGAMDVLIPYIKSGVLKVKSGHTAIKDIAITKWSSGDAQERMDSLLESYYKNERINVVLSPNDSIAQGIVASLKSHGYGSKDKPFPILTGQDCDKINVGQIIRGEQSVSIFKDTRLLKLQAIKMVDAILSGKEVPVNTVYNNGMIDVPSYNCEGQCVDADNWKEVLIDSGYYTAGEIPAE